MYKKLCISAVSCDGGRPGKQQDCILVDKYSSENHSRFHKNMVLRNEGFVKAFAVFDGMGAYEAGDYASKKAAAGIQEAFTDKFKSLDEITIDFVFQVIETVKQYFNSWMWRCGTTMSLVLIDPAVNKARVYNVGDSPVCHYSDGRLMPVYEAMRSQMYTNIITSAIGTNMSIKVAETSFDFSADDKILICSDGLEALTFERVGQIMAKKFPATALYNEAMIRGAYDNISVIVLEFK